MKLIVWQIVGDFDVKYGKRIGEKYTRIVFKSLDETDTKSYYLNLPLNYKHHNEWSKDIKEGNVLDVELQPNGNNIDYFKPYKVIKEVGNVTYERSVEG